MKNKAVIVSFAIIIFILLQSFVSAKINDRRPEIYSTSTTTSKFTNGEFFVKYNEEGINKVILNYGKDNAIKTDCESGRNKKCAFKVDLKKYENQEIKYFFVIIDQNGNIGESMAKKVKVDTTLPIILNPDSIISIKNNNVFFKIKINEENLERVEYVDNFNSNSPVVLCRNKNCNSKKRFNSGSYSLTIRIFDKVGNYAEKVIFFSV